MPASASSVSYNTSQFTNTHPTVQNVVATANFQVRLVLANIVLHARNVEYCPKRFSAVIIRIREPKATGLIFATGRLVVTGARSEDLARLAARKFARIIQKIGYQVKFAEFKIQNVVATYAFGSSIRLEGLARKHRQFAHYEPEIFPGLVYRMAQGGVILIFTTGRIVITGTKSREAMSQVFDNIYPVLVEFEKHEGPEDEDSTAIALGRE